MKGDHGSSIFNRQVVYYLHPLTSSENQVTGRISGDPLPPFKPIWAEPLPLGYIPRPLQKMKERPASVEIILQPLIRGRRPQIGLEEGVETIFGLFSSSLGGQAADIETSAG